MRKLRGADVVINDGGFVLVLADRRQIPFWWKEFPKLSVATRSQREDWRWIADGLGIRWPQVDVDLEVEGLVTNSGVHTK